MIGLSCAPTATIPAPPSGRCSPAPSPCAWTVPGDRDPLGVRVARGRSADPRSFALLTIAARAAGHGGRRRRVQPAVRARGQ